MLELNVGIRKVFRSSNLRGLESLEIVTQVSSDTFLVFTHTTLFLSITLSNNVWGKVIIFFMWYIVIYLVARETKKQK